MNPAGLTQLISLKYGTVPIVRGVGGLVSTVFDRDYDTNKPPEKRNGYVFYQTDTNAPRIGHRKSDRFVVRIS